MDEWGLTWYFIQAHMVQEGPLMRKLSTVSGAFDGETIVKHDSLEYNDHTRIT
jgi:hypothetical protein